MSIEGSLVFDIALGIIVADVLTHVLKDIQRFVGRRGPREKVNLVGDDPPVYEEDWLELWSSVPESVKEESRRLIEDDQLGRRAQELNLWPYLWSAAPEETKEKLRSRWKVAKIQPKVGA